MRDAGEAQRARIEALERELEDAHAALERLREPAERVRALEAERDSLKHEVLQLSRRGPWAIWRSRAVLGLVALVVVLLFGLVWIAEDRNRARASARQWREDLMQEREAAASWERRRTAAQASANQGTLDLAAREWEVSTRLLGLELEPEPEAPPLAPFEPWTALGRVEYAIGQGVPMPGMQCTMDVTHAGSRCRAEVRCNGELVFPGEGGDGLVACELDAGRVVRASSMRPGAPTVGAQLVFDRGTIRVGGSAPRPWRVEIPVTRSTPI